MKRLLIISLFLIPCFLKGQVLVPVSLNLSVNDGPIYWMGTIAFSAVNGTTTYFNIKKLHKYDKYRTNAIFGAISGGAQTALGLAYLKPEYKDAYIPTFINIGFGITTLVTSVVRLATKNPPKENNVSLNFICLPGNDNYSSIVVLTLKKQF